MNLTNTKIYGRDELHSADVITEKGFNKLFVKATSAPQVLGNLFFTYLKNGIVEDMRVNGSLIAPITYQYQNTTANDLVVSSIQFEIECVSPGAAGFASSGARLTNGLLIEVKSEDTIFQFLPITRNYEFDSRFAQGPGGSFLIYNGTGNDYIGAKFGPSNPFLLKKTGTYGTDDYIRVLVRDNLTGAVAVSIKNLIFGAFDV